MARYTATYTTTVDGEQITETYTTYSAGTGTKVHLRVNNGSPVICGSSRKPGRMMPNAEVTCGNCLAQAETMERAE